MYQRLRQVKSRIIEEYKKRFGFYQYSYLPFDFPKPMPSSAFKTMTLGCDILKKLGIRFCVSYGTLLGIYRNNALIQHDSDIDVDVLRPCSVAINDIENEFKKNGFKICVKTTLLGEIQQLAFYTRDEVVFDLAFYKKIGKSVYCFHEYDYYFQFPAQFYDTLGAFTFNNYELYFPHEPEEWLAYTYGKNWKIPKLSKNLGGYLAEKDEYGMIRRSNKGPAAELKKLLFNAKNV